MQNRSLSHMGTFPKLLLVTLHSLVNMSRDIRRSSDWPLILRNLIIMFVSLRGETGNMGQRVIWDSAEKQLQLETSVWTAAL